MFCFKKGFFLSLILLSNQFVFSQYNAPFYLSSTETAARAKMHESIIQNIILKNLQMPLDDETEENWQGAFNAMEVVDFHNTFTWQKMQEAMTALPFHSLTFQRFTLEAAYTLYPDHFIHEAATLMNTTTDAKIFAMCAVYLLKSGKGIRLQIEKSMYNSFGDSAMANPILSSLNRFMNDTITVAPQQIVKSLFSKDFLKGQTMLFSFQRKNRDYPGMVLIRKKDGSFLKIDGDYFHIPQLARGIANLPYFLTKGNTPQGIYRMFGFGVSSSQFIGPTANVQMGMPVELKKNKFFDNNSDTSQWTLNDYMALLPNGLKDYLPLQESFYAGMAGRNEIIAHGTTIDPEYNRKKPYYPMTPTEGCLCTKEFWDGKLIYSDQQKLVNALLAAGGANGYVVVFELDDKQEPVTMADVVKYFN